MACFVDLWVWDKIIPSLKIGILFEGAELRLHSDTLYNAPYCLKQPPEAMTSTQTQINTFLYLNFNIAKIIIKYINGVLKLNIKQIMCIQ